MQSETRRRERVELDPLTLARAQRGETAAFRALVEYYERPVFALLSRMMLGRLALVEDLAQETFVRVFRSLPGFGQDGRLHLSSWILTIATRLALDELRKRTFATEPFERAVETLPGPWRADADQERRALGQAIAGAVSRLSPEHRAAFLLREVHELEYEAIAGALGVDLGTVKSRLARARAALRSALSEYYDAKD